MDLPELPTPLGRSPSFLKTMATISLLAPLSKPVLVIGERGTGKELVAARLHYLSSRWNQPFVKLNCAALSESLLEAELFGHEAGSFTGAQKRRLGRFELAHRGTLFLDEIANAPMNVQETILRVVEYGTFERVGGSDTIRVDVRLVAATNVDLPALAAAGKFRADLLDRLAFDVVTLPPLRHRPEDIELLAEYMALEMTKELKRDVFPGFTQQAIDQLMDYDWPGNVRELKNVIERAVYRATDLDEPIDEIVFDPFASPWRPFDEALPGSPSPAAPQAVASAALPLAAPATPPAPVGPYDFCEHVRLYERDLLKRALEANAHHQKNTAQYLAMTYHQLRANLRKHGLIGG
ncbi:PSP operon transcriptional activator [Aliidongia dinghuensis]|uniref:PSP operon transcriptional activator n=2 Tax=Aliidongia dinghuensis TaxID=1867774 RepID=A0A8J2Z126_9PROT|nr:PSP operon transcriptional activator [Aliidongia dinghuensis]